MDFILNFFDFSSPLFDQWVYVFIFLIAILESLPLLGLFIPGALVVILSGFLAKSEILHLLPVIVSATAGAFIGDAIGYFIGKHYGYTFLVRYGRFFFFKKEYLEKTQKFVNSHTGKSLVIGRFNSLTRTFTPFVVGASLIRFRNFLFYAFFGSLSWALVHVFIGYIFGQGYELASKYLGFITFGAIILSGLIIYSYRFVNTRRHVFEKYRLYTLIANIFSLYIFSKMTDDVLKGEWLTIFDVTVHEFLKTIVHPALTHVMVYVTDLGSALVIGILSFAVLLYYAIKKRWYGFFLVLLSVSGGGVFVYTIKNVILRLRPDGGLILETGFSFPSGHALLSAIFFTLLIYLFKGSIKNKTLRAFYIAGNIFFISLISFSRLYLGVHWLTDVLAGVAIGVFWVTLLVLIFRILIWQKERIKVLGGKIPFLASLFEIFQRD